jgi:hypothetical protein
MSIESGDFTGLGSLTILSVVWKLFLLVKRSRVILSYLHSNRISSIESGDFTGLGNLTELSVVMIRRNQNIMYSCERRRSLDSNPITLINVGAFSGLSELSTL